MARRLLLLRHGQTEFNATRRMQGHFDTELSQTGWQQAQAAAEMLVGQPIVKIIASDLRRAKDTAQVIGDQLNLPVSLDSRLRETDLGDWQGKTHEEVDSAFPGARARWRFDATWAPPNAETRQEVAARAFTVVEDLLQEVEQWEGNTVLIVAHGGTISALTSALLGFADSKHPLFSNLGNTQLAQIVGRDVPEGYPVHGNKAVQWYVEGWNIDCVL